jgi:hypothetical protein
MEIAWYWMAAAEISAAEVSRCDRSQSAYAA